MQRVLVADHNPASLTEIENLLQDAGLRVALAREHSRVLGLLDQGGVDLVILEAALPGLDGLAGVSSLRSRHPKIPVVIISGGGATDEVIEATKLGVFDYVFKPIEPKTMLRLVKQALEARRFLGDVVRMEPEDEFASGDALVGRSRPMQEVYQAIGRVAPTTATVLIRGESGTGKELVARAIYQHSQRKGGPFVVVNCVAIPETLLESELFGFEKGAFTGAQSRRIGKIEQAHRGTILLDEIGDMPLSVQAKLLRLIESKSIERIGGRGPMPVDVRILAATNRDLEGAIEAGQFREDLFYRLNVVPITLPPLRERPEDIPLLANYFLQRFAGSLAVRSPGFSQKALDLLAVHDWPGNVRELANAMEKCLIFSRGHQIGEKEILSLVLDQEDQPGRFDDLPIQEIKAWAIKAMASGRRNLLASATEQVSRLLIEEALKLTKGNRSRSAALLGLTRQALLSRMQKLGLADKYPVSRG